MPPKAVEGIHMGRFRRLEGQIIQRVPEEHIGDYKYWRATHLGAVALNFMEDVRVISIRGRSDQAGTKFTDYETALKEAEETVGAFKETPKYQFGSQEHHRFRKLTGVREDFRYPVLVHALGENHYTAGKTVYTDEKTGSNTIVDKDYFIVDEDTNTAVHIPPLTIYMADPYSQQFLSDIIKSLPRPHQGVKT